MIWRFLASLVMRLVEPLVIYWKGRSDARREAERRDYENADAIRRRTERDLPDKLREYEGRGYRDNE